MKSSVAHPMFGEYSRSAVSWGLGEPFEEACFIYREDAKWILMVSQKSWFVTLNLFQGLVSK